MTGANMLNAGVIRPSAFWSALVSFTGAASRRLRRDAPSASRLSASSLSSVFTSPNARATSSAIYWIFTCWSELIRRLGTTSERMSVMLPLQLLEIPELHVHAAKARDRAREHGSGDQL